MFQKLVIQKLGAYQKGKLYSRQRTGCQEGKLLSVLRTKIASLFSLPSCPLNFCSSDNDPLPCPPPREGACSRKFNQQSNACHCERQNGASQSHNLYNINEITTSNASHSPRNDIENSCKTHVPGAAATLPHRGEGISKKLLKHRGQSDVRKILKQVQDDRNISLKPTDSLINLFSYSPRKRCAFTLAEVLITLGIIGMVAAMTMPVIIQNVRAKVLQTQLKKAYSVISQATQQFINDEQQIPNPQNYTEPQTQFFKPLAKYFNGGVFCSNTECSDLFDKIISTYKNYPKNTLFSGTGVIENCLDDGFITTNDSMLIVLDRGTCKSDRFLLTVDINGINKPPNALGHDFFVFEIEPENGSVIPSGGNNSAYSDETCRTNGPLFDNEGVGCTAKALLDNDYFKHLP